MVEPGTPKYPEMMIQEGRDARSWSHGWFIRRDDDHSGPLSIEVLRVMLGQMHEPTDSFRVWHPTLNQWLSVEDVRTVLDRRQQEASPSGHAYQLQTSLPSDTFPLIILGAAFVGFVYWFSHMFTPKASNIDLTSVRQEAMLYANALSQYQETASEFSIELCNHSSHPKVFTAVSYFDNVAKQWNAKGWYVIESNTCTKPLEGIKPPIYVYGETDAAAKRWGGGEDGEIFCIRDNRSFDLTPRDCQRGIGAGLRWEGFSKLELPEKGNVATWNISD